MQRPSTPLLGLLAAVVIFAVLYVVALKGSSSSSSSAPLGQFSHDIAAAHGAVTTEAKSNAAAAGTTATSSATPAAAAASSSTPVAASSTPAATTTTPSASGGAAVGATGASGATSAASATAQTATAAGSTGATGATSTAVPAKTKVGPLRTPAQREAATVSALKAGKVVALLFYNPGAADDQANRKELSTIPTLHGHVFRLAIPISELSNYGAVTNQVPVSVSPTLVIIDQQHYATTIVGYASRAEIQQRIQDALAVPPSAV